MATIGGTRAVLAVKAALEEAGLGRTSTMGGGGIAGWIPSNQFGSTGFSIRREKDGSLGWNVVISGEPHLGYRRHRSGDTDLHTPVNPERLCPRIRRVFESLDIRVEDVRVSGWQEHWDDDVEYLVTTAHPAWLGQPDPRNRPDPAVCDHVLVGFARSAAGVGPNQAEWVHVGLPTLVGYTDKAGRTLMTRESLDAFVAASLALDERKRAEAARGWKPFQAPSYAFDGDEFVRRFRDRETDRVRPETITNFWGDEVEVWQLPKRHFAPTPSFRPQVPFLMQGEMRDKASFAEIDIQYGADAPWSVEPPAPGAPRP